MAYAIGFLLYPELTQLDLTGPAQVLHRMPGARVHYLAASMAPVPSDCGLSLLPTATFADAPALDMICVPGGYGCAAAMRDVATLGWLREAAARASLVTSVCTGSLVLAAAGLLRGYRAACHWAWGDSLALFGAQWVQERVVVDRDRITGGGVTAGIDFAFRVIAEPPRTRRRRDTAARARVRSTAAGRRHACQRAAGDPHRRPRGDGAQARAAPRRDRRHRAPGVRWGASVARRPPGRVLVLVTLSVRI